jgi:hypothetical protein
LIRPIERTFEEWQSTAGSSFSRVVPFVGIDYRSASGVNDSG